MNNIVTMPDDFLDEVKEWFAGYPFEIIHIWKESGFDTYNVVVHTVDTDYPQNRNHIVCVRAFKSIYQPEKIFTSVDSDFVVPAE